MTSQVDDRLLPIQKFVLRPKPWQEGMANAARVLVRLRDEPRYWHWRRAEHDALASLSQHPLSVEEFLGRYFSGQGAMSFKEALGFLEKLVEQEGLEGLSPDTKAALLQLVRQAQPEISPWLLAYQRLWRLLDIPLLRFHDGQWDDGLARVGRWLLSPWGLGSQALLLLVLVATQPVMLASHKDLAQALINEPELLFLRVLLAFSVALSLTSLWQVIALLGSGVRFVGGSLRLTALVLLNFAVDDADIRMQARGTVWRYRLQALLMPFLAAMICASLPHDELSFAQLLSFAFFAFGACHLCPLLRGQLVRLGEDLTVTNDLIERSNAFLARGLFRGILKPSAAASHGAATEAVTEACLVAFASLSLLWLYGVSTFFSELFVRQLPMVIDKCFVLLQAMHGEGTGMGSALASLFMAALLALAALLPAWRFFLIMGQNLYSVAQLPLQKARAGLRGTPGQAIPPDLAVGAFLKTIPIFQHLSEASLHKLGRYLRFKRYPRHASIISQGDEGRAFYILAQGEASVIVESQEGMRRVVDVLKPGDSFGEVALVEKVRRTATVRAKTPVLTLILDRRQFNAVFPDGSPERQSLTATIRLVKLIADAKAFSHFTPVEVRTLLREATMVHFAKGEAFIEEGQEADSAYLIASGHVRVQHGSGQTTVAVLGRGELVGTIALVKERPRTATVVAETDVSCLRIDKASFRRLCLQNPLVAMLVTEEADRQLGELEAS